MQRGWNVLPFSITTLMTLCKSHLEKLPKDSNKICQLFARIPYNTYFGKYDEISDSKEEIFRGVPLQQIWMLQANEFCKKISIAVLFWRLENFFRTNIKSNSWWITQKILNKKLSRSYRGRVEGLRLQWNSKQTNKQKNKVNPYKNIL